MSQPDTKQYGADGHSWNHHLANYDRAPRFFMLSRIFIFFHVVVVVVVVVVIVFFAKMIPESSK